MRRTAGRTWRVLAAGGGGLALVVTLTVPGAAAPSRPVAADAVTPGTAAAAARHTDKNATAFGTGGAVASVDPEATRAGLSVLKRGGNAVDAAVATAAALGVTEPYSAGIGGGGYFVYYDARTRKVTTLDGRETAPAALQRDAFLDPATGQPYRFFPELVTSGVSVGVPGTPATWRTALRRWGTLDLQQALRPAVKVARRGFVVDSTFRRQTLENKERFSAISTTADLYLPDGDAPRIGTVFRNPDLADSYEALGRSTRAFYRGRIAKDIVRTVQDPPTVKGTKLPVPEGSLELADLTRYRVIERKPTKVRYRGLGVYGMGPSSSGGSTVGEALNILGTAPLAGQPRAAALHRYLDASALAFADRNAYVGDPAYVDVPLKTLLSKRFARTRACQIDPVKALVTPTLPGDLDAEDCATASPQGRNDRGTSTTHLVTADRWGNVVSYTLTIEQTGGSGIVVPGRGFLLNNELTDFTALYDPADPNRIEGGKRPRSSMSPTIVLRRGKPVLALGSPGGSTIITTVLQTLVNRIDFGMSLPQAVAEPRASLRNTEKVTAEQAFIDRYGPALTAAGYTLAPAGTPGTSAAEIGAVAALRFFPRGRIQAVAEPERRGGGDARVVKPRRR